MLASPRPSSAQGWHLADTGCWHYCLLRVDAVAQPTTPCWLSRVCDGREGRRRAKEPKLAAAPPPLAAGQTMCPACIRALVDLRRKPA